SASPKYKGKAFSKENFNHLLESIETFGRERGKLAMKKEFENLYGIDKFREMKKLSPIKKAVKISTTFVDEFAEKNIKQLKKLSDLSQSGKNQKLHTKIWQKK
ncbi:hypothetical protein P9756_14115, partial [Heyndrickxia coagulans]|nr:hypothetical protein [Heyndrickxia coagulans]